MSHEVRLMSRTREVDAASSHLEAEAFLSALVRGAPWAAEEAWSRYSTMVYDLLRRGLGPGADVDDAVQEVFLRVFERVKTLRDSTALRSFVFSIGVRVMRWQLRRRMIRRWVMLSPSGDLPEIGQAPVDTEAREALRRVYELLEHLKPLDRTIFILRQSEDMSLPEIARAVEVSLSMVKRRFKRTAARMGRLIQADPLLCTYVSRHGLFSEDPDGGKGGEDAGLAEERGNDEGEDDGDGPERGREDEGGRHG